MKWCFLLIIYYIYHTVNLFGQLPDCGGAGEPWGGAAEAHTPEHGAEVWWHTEGESTAPALHQGQTA